MVRYINDVGLHRGDDAMSVNGFEITVIKAETGLGMVLTTLLSYGAVTFHCGPCEKRLRDGKLATSSKRNSPCTWVSSSSCTRSESEAKRCLVRSWRYSSHTTLESIMSLTLMDVSSIRQRAHTERFQR